MNRSISKIMKGGFLTINYIGKFSKIMLSISCMFLFISLLGGCTKLSENTEISSEETSIEESSEVVEEVESWESCYAIMETSYGLEPFLNCRIKIPERDFMAIVGTIIEPEIADGKYHYTYQESGFEMILDYPFTEHIYVIERILPDNRPEGMIYAYENTGKDVYLESIFYFHLMSKEEVEKELNEAPCWINVITQINEDAFLVSERTLSYGGTENMMNLLKENLVTYDTLDEFLEHAEFRLLD